MDGAHEYAPLHAVIGTGWRDPQFTMQAVVTCFVLAASLFVILAKRDSAKDKHWAYATVGTILGFWLHFSM